MLVSAASTCGSSSGSDQKLCNPVGFTSIADLVAAVLNGVVTISLPILTLYIVYSGFLFVKARGKPGELEIAKINFLYVIIGAIFILGAWTFAVMIGSTVTQIVGSS